VQRKAVLLIVTIALTVGGFGAVLATNSTPKLGLDLKGGLSIVLAPKGKAKHDAIRKAKDIIDNRVNGLGVAEPNVAVQGNNIVIDLPGVKDPKRAEQILGQTAKLLFRPVLAPLPPFSKSAADELATTTTTAPGATTTTTAPGATTTTVKGATTTTAKPPPDPQAAIPSSTVDDPNQSVILPSRERSGGTSIRYELGPAELQGDVVKGARAQFISGQGWLVTFDLTGKGSKAFDDLANRNFGKQVAIDLDGVVQSAPTINARNFNGHGQITGNFKQKDAKDLALVLRYGALPVDLKQLTVQTVSPTLGRDQLRSGIAAGLIGLAIVAIYMLVYYRLLGMVVWAGLVMSALALYALTAWLGNTISLTLTLAGVTGIIVSVGVTVDSYVVYFERLKDEVRTGKTIRSSLDRGFSRSFRTILAADFVSLIAAVLLYLLAIGSVRGFAFFLGMSTALDIVIAYCFMHPLVSIIGRRPSFTQAGWLGVAKALDAEGATV